MTIAQPTPPDTRTTILQKAVLLFSQTGYSGVSMRDIAGAVGISATALYHHFADKDSLYLDAVQYVFSDKALQGHLALQTTGSAEMRLEAFIHTLVRLMSEDPSFRRLLQRELLDGDERRLKLLATQIFADQVDTIAGLVQEIAPDFDPYMLLFLISGMIIHHLETAPLRRFYPSSRAEHDDPEFIANQVTCLVLYGIKGMPTDD